MSRLEEKLSELAYFLGNNFVPFGREYRKKFTRYVDIVLFTNPPIEKIIDYTRPAIDKCAAHIGTIRAKHHSTFTTSR